MNEESVRANLIDPLFEALGWDVRNKNKLAPGHFDVTFQPSIESEGQQKRPDYVFSPDGRIAFFVEAKKCAADLRARPEPAHQIRRYGRAPKLALSILTNFEDLIVYNCKLPLRQGQDAGCAVMFRWGYREYVEKWPEIWGKFSREAVRTGRFDAFVRSMDKRGTLEIDDEFLKDIEEWRKSLAQGIYSRNFIPADDLNRAVQMTIDRLIFLRMAEDRGTETDKQLLSLCDEDHICQGFMRLCRGADDKYNSGLFHFQDNQPGAEKRDTLTPGLVVDDHILKPIIRRLYPEYDCHYQFNLMPIEILGTVYERFLGKVIRITEHRAVPKDKPAVIKAKGVHYTPIYIAEYIVSQTVDVQIAALSPKELAAKPYRMLDMACGSGTFLLAGYQHLLDHCLRWYVANTPNDSRVVYQDEKTGQWRLTIHEKKRILTAHVFGVDIDPQAVEVSKLSLLLKVLENENAETVGLTRKLFHERPLPNLGRNIKCGNSLVSSDYFAGRPEQPDTEERARINPFDWKHEFSPGRFDCVIGNPPWGATFTDDQKPYLLKKYRLHSGKYESYFYFVEQATTLLSHDGAFGYIIPSFWISRSQTKQMRDHLFGTLWPRAFVLLPENVFPRVKMNSCIVIAGRQEPRVVHVCEVSQGELPAMARVPLAQKTYPVPFRSWRDDPQLRFNPRVSPDDSGLLTKLGQDALPLSEAVEITQGLTLYRRSTLIAEFGKAKAEEIVTQRLFHSDRKKNRTYKKELLGRDVGRYCAEWNGRSWVSYGPWLAHAVSPRFFTGPRLVVQKLRNPTLPQRLVAGYLDDDETYSAGVLLNAILRPETPYRLFYLLGILNSKAINYWYRKSFLDVSIRVVDLAKVPVRRINFADKAAKANHDRLAKLADVMLKLNKQLASAGSETKSGLIQRQIEATDAEIDRLVYGLYGLTQDEIAIVEGPRHEE